MWCYVSCNYRYMSCFDGSCYDGWWVLSMTWMGLINQCDGFLVWCVPSLFYGWIISLWLMGHVILLLMGLLIKIDGSCHYSFDGSCHYDWWVMSLGHFFYFDWQVTLLGDGTGHTCQSWCDRCQKHPSVLMWQVLSITMMWQVVHVLTWQVWLTAIKILMQISPPPSFVQKEKRTERSE